MINNEIMNRLGERIKLIQEGGEDGSHLFLVGPIRLPVDLDGETVFFNWYSWIRTDKKETPTVEQLLNHLPASKYADQQQSSVLVYGDFQHAEDAMIRMHSICHTGDIFGSKRCDCGFQLKQSMRMIKANGTGALFYLANHEGRGIGLFSKAMAYLLQEDGMDTVDANLALGFQDDTRSYADAIVVLKELRGKPVSIITNNPRKVEALKKAGMDINKRIPLWGEASVHNEKYLSTKVNKSGHFRSEYQTALQ
ncbi:GTP cyclohydrolase II [Paenibacillus protaetiae]|uniref:GTP cyclohydrolase II n=1 Tax=Paenibacillus protaetiae TaxID=2509456 RepID=A0A4P6F0X0_9BACL|nr:GTP cyclohydrolase II [Paenibacillus protaetiae]QAY66657.1 GTP cyclohydrolase II [Paenibacillus protaetiae]